MFIPCRQFVYLLENDPINRTALLLFQKRLAKHLLYYCSNPAFVNLAKLIFCNLFIDKLDRRIFFSYNCSWGGQSIEYIISYIYSWYNVYKNTEHLIRKFLCWSTTTVIFRIIIANSIFHKPFSQVLYMIELINQ